MSSPDYRKKTSAIWVFRPTHRLLQDLQLKYPDIKLIHFCDQVLNEAIIRELNRRRIMEEINNESGNSTTDSATRVGVDNKKA